MTEESGPKIVSDEGWKEQAKQEKKKLAEEEKAKKAQSAGPGAAAGPLPPADFMTLVHSLTLQALYSLGKLAQSDKEPTPLNLDLAKHHIDTLQVLEDKTKGNLSEQESQALALTLQELRMQYVAAAQA